MEVSEDTHSKLCDAVDEALGFAGVARKHLPNHLYIALLSRLKVIHDRLQDFIIPEPQLVEDDPDEYARAQERGDRKYHEGIDRELTGVGL